MFLLVKCEEVYRAICDLEWYKWKSTQARNLILLMVQIQEPFRVTAGKILPLSMAIFCSIRLLIISTLTTFYFSFSLSCVLI